MDSTEHKFSKSFLILKLDNVKLIDLLLFLHPTAYKKTKFIHCSESNEDSYKNFKDRVFIFFYILLQLFLIAIAPGLAKLDAFLVKYLNLISFNGGILGLLSNIFKGKAPVKPNKKSPYYTSLVGFTDWRRDLDLSIQPHDKFRYYGGLTMMAAKIAYESEPFVQSVVNDRWKMKFLGFFDFWNDFQNRATTQAFMFQNTATNDPNIIVIAFRGTSPFDTYDWQVDTDLSWYNIEGVGHIHSGFMKALGLQKATGWPKELTKPQHDFAYYTLRQKLRDIVKSNDKARFIITGHSLGGALATLFVTMLSYHEEKTILKKLQGVYTYGQPRVGDRQFAEFMMVKEQPNKNYFSLQWVIPKYLTALWEIIRSFITPLVWGFDYYESLLMIGARLVGLLVPGFAAHFPVNYVNSTRLGKLTASNEVDDPIHEDDIESDD